MGTCRWRLLYEHVYVLAPERLENPAIKAIKGEKRGRGVCIALLI